MPEAHNRLTVSPGTLTDDALLDPRESNYLAAVALPAHRNNGDDRAGVAWAELSTGRFFAASVPVARLADELARIGGVVRERRRLLPGGDLNGRTSRR